MIRAETVVIATGSAPVELPSLPFGDPVISSTEALALREVPEKLVVVGGGYIGLELGTAFAKIGAKVTVVEALPRILPLYDAELTRPVGKRLAELGVEVLTGAKARGLTPRNDALLVEIADGKKVKVPADKVLVAVGRKPLTDGWGMEELALDMAGKFIRIDDQCRTSMRGVYAIGDVTGEPMLAHRAMAQGEMVAEIVAGHKRSWDKRSIPADLLHRSGSGVGRTFAGGGADAGPGGEDRAFPVPGQRPRHDHARRGRIYPHHCRAPTTTWCSASRRSGKACRSFPPPSRWPSRWAHGWRTSPVRSTRIRRRARRSRKLR